MKVNGHETFVSIGNKIVVYDRGNIVRTYEEHDSEILGMVCVGKILLSYDKDNNIKVINI